MSNLVTYVELDWADGRYKFQLHGAQIEELEKKTDAGFGALYRRVMSGNWRHADIVETIRLALIGGGMSALEAKRKVDFYAEQPFAEGDDSPVSAAMAVLNAVMLGVEPQPEGERAA